MLIKILFVLAAIVVIFVIVVSLQSSDYRTSRSATIAASPAVVFAQLNNLHHYAVWNPFGKEDPTMKTSFEGPETGPGSTLHWSGNNCVGEGRMTITESRPDEYVRMALDFVRPFPSSATAEFTVQPQNGQTVVTWTMFGQRTFIPKAVGLFLNMDKMIGGAFETGLAELKAIAEDDVKK